MLQRAVSAVGGGSGNANYYYEKQTYSGSTSFTIKSGLSDITRISVICVTSASDLYVSEFEYIKNGSTVTIWSDYMINNGATAMIGIRHTFPVAGYQNQCPNITGIDPTNGDITVLSPSTATWNTGTMYIWVSNEPL